MIEDDETTTLAEAQAEDAEEVRTEEENVEPERLKYQDGTWKGIPNFKCPHCNLREVNRDPAEAARRIDIHIEKRHPTNWLEGV